MNFVYRKTELWLRNGQDLDALDLRALLVRSGSTIGTQIDAAFLADFTDLRECDAGGYARKTLTGEALTENVGANRLQFASSDADFSTLSLGPSAEAIAAFLLFFHLGGGTAAENRPYVHINQVPVGSPFFPYMPLVSGGPFKVKCPATGWLHFKP